MIYDDFKEIRAGAAKDLETQLKARQYLSWGHSNSDSGSPCSRSSSIREEDTTTAASPVDHASLSTDSRDSTAGLAKPQETPEISLEAPPPALPERLFLLLCIPHRNIATKLVHMDVCTLLSDQQFFSSLRNHYCSMRGQWSRVFSLSQLTCIRFVFFEMYPSALVDIHKNNDIPPADRKYEYPYRPMPAEIVPPIGENHLMHLFDHPEDAEDSPICLDKVPKKVRDRLRVCPQRGTGLGWGIHFVEGPHWKKLWLLGFLGFLMSIAFGIAWASMKDDTQGGFGIAACLMVGVTYTISIVKAALEPKKTKRRLKE